MSVMKQLGEFRQLASRAMSAIAEASEAIRTASVASDLDLGSAARALRLGHDFVTAIRSGGPIRRPSRHGTDWIFLCSTGHSSPGREWRNVCSGARIGLDLEDYLARDWETMVPVAVSARDSAPSASPAVGTFPWAIAQGRPIRRSSFGSHWILLGRKVVTSHPRSTEIACLRSVDRGEEWGIHSWDYEATDWVVAGSGLRAEPIPAAAAVPPVDVAPAAPISSAASWPRARQEKLGCPCDDGDAEGCYKHGIGAVDDPEDPRPDPTSSGSRSGATPS